jgi:hypothetical protein
MPINGFANQAQIVYVPSLLTTHDLLQTLHKLVLGGVQAGRLRSKHVRIKPLPYFLSSPSRVLIRRDRLAYSTAGTAKLTALAIGSSSNVLVTFRTQLGGRALRTVLHERAARALCPVRFPLP